MPSEDWYRNTKWNKSIENNFYSKLKRARSQRDQYLVIQALMLAKDYPEITHNLVEEYFSSRKDKYEDVRALLARAKAYMTQRKVEEAMEAFREVLGREKEFPNHQTTTYVDYPYIVATQEISDEYINVVQSLEDHVDRLMFPIDHFKWHASKALILKDKDHARLALEEAKIKKSSFRFHQDVGIVGKEHAKTIRRLHKLCT